MTRRIKSDCGCAPADRGVGCCRVESLVGVDERGQMVLPKEIREKANIRAGDKLVVTSWEKDGRICCLFLIKAEDFGAMVRGMLGPMMSDILQGGNESEK